MTNPLAEFAGEHDTPRIEQRLSSVCRSVSNRESVWKFSSERECGNFFAGELCRAEVLKGLLPAVEDQLDRFNLLLNLAINL
jgi:hypothetical protein